MMSFDECPMFPASHEYVKNSIERTIRWAKRGKEAHHNDSQALFGIVQGGIYPDLRKRCAEELVKMDFPGYSIGGVSVGENKDEMKKMIDYSIEYLPLDKPRYLMGVGSVDGILEGIERGVDMFDCVLPTRLARHGAALTTNGRVNIKAASHEFDFTPLDSSCCCPCCKKYSRAYLRHLFHVGEDTGKKLLTIHNITFLINLVNNARAAIKEGRFKEFKEDVYRSYKIDDSHPGF
ncbi:queuine trna-ribosyltransferase [Holotrichia oblita]|nr:queuine trna-ribosyltransferase [Holotrichia oblita]